MMWLLLCVYPMAFCDNKMYIFLIASWSSKYTVIVPPNSKFHYDSFIDGSMTNFSMDGGGLSSFMGYMGFKMY